MIRTCTIAFSFSLGYPVCDGHVYLPQGQNPRNHNALDSGKREASGIKTSLSCPSIDSYIQQVIVIIPPAFAFTTIDHDLVLLLVLALVLRNRIQQILQLVLRDFLAELARLGEHDQTILDIHGPGLFDEANPAEAIGGGWIKDLVQDGGATFGCDGQSRLHALHS